MDTHQLISEDQDLQNLSNSELYRAVPLGPRNVLVELYYRKEIKPPSTTPSSSPSLFFRVPRAPQQFFAVARSAVPLRSHLSDSRDGAVQMPAPEKEAKDVIRPSLTDSESAEASSSEGEARDRSTTAPANQARERSRSPPPSPPLSPTTGRPEREQLPALATLEAQAEQADGDHAQEPHAACGHAFGAPRAVVRAR